MANKVKLIFNPIANLGRAWPIATALRPIVQELGGADWVGTVYPTHATELARQAGEEGYDRVIALGGDGTMHEVINGLMQLPTESRPQLGIVPVGSGNDFSHAIGVSPDPLAAIRQALVGEPHKIDIGQITDNLGRSEYWANAVGIGFDTIVTINSRKVPVLKGFGIYLAAVLKTILMDYEYFKVDVKMDGKEWQREVFMLVLCNGPREGGGFHVYPNANPSDGLLNYLAFDKMSRMNMFLSLPGVMNGTHDRNPHAHFGEYKKMEIRSNRPLYIHTDGEIFADPAIHKVDELSIEIKPGALVVVC